jgi:integrase
VEDGLLEVDPTARIPAVRVPRGLPRPVTDVELARLVAGADARMRAWLLLMALAGLRCLEVAYLRPSDLIPSDTGTLLYLRECKGGGTATVPAHPTGARGARTGPGPQRAVVVGATAHRVRPRSPGTSGPARCRERAPAAALRRDRLLPGLRHDLLTTAPLLRHANVQTSTIYAQPDPVRPPAVVNACRCR